MKLIINGQEKETPDNATLKNIVEQFCKNTVHVIAEVNGDIVKRHQWDERKLLSGDAVELVNFVGGG